jgi:biotin carboxyl carrier protein
LRQVVDGQEVKAGDVICIVEAMRMENEVHAQRAGFVQELSVHEGDPVATGQVICRLEAIATASRSDPDELR